MTRKDLSLVISLFCALLLIVLSFTITSMGSLYIVSDLGGDRTIATYALSFFGFGTAMTIPLAVPIADRYGDRSVLCGSVICCSLTTLLCAVAPTYFFFVCARLLTGMASGLFYPLLVRCFSARVPSQYKIVTSWVFVTILIVGPVIGACWGGTVSYLYNWRALFFLNSTVGLLLTWMIWVCWEDDKKEGCSLGFDWTGWVFYALSMIALTFALTTAQQLDWYRSDLLIVSVFVGVPSFFYYLLRSIVHPTPVLDLSLFSNPMFSFAIGSLSLLFAVYFGIIVLLPVWLTLDVKFTPLWIAVLLGSMGIAGLFPRFILEGSVSRLDPRILIGLGTVLLAFSCFYTTVFNSEINFGRIAFSRVVAGFGIALSLPSIFQLLHHTSLAEQWIRVFEIFQSARNLSCSLGAAVFSIIWQRRTVFYHERLGEILQSQSQPVEVFLNKVDTWHVPGNPAAQLNSYLHEQASSLALNDVFFLMGWMLVALLIVILVSPLFAKLSLNNESL